MSFDSGKPEVDAIQVGDVLEPSFCWRDREEAGNNHSDPLGARQAKAEKFALLLTIQNSLNKYGVMSSC